MINMSRGGSDIEDFVKIVVSVIIVIIIFWILFGLLLPAFCKAIEGAGGTCFI